VLFSRQLPTIADRVVSGLAPVRLQALEGEAYAEAVEEWLDYWARGIAQLDRLKTTIVSRSGVQRDARDPESNYAGDYDASPPGEGLSLTEDGRAVRDETTELVTCGFAQRIAKDLGVLYASDDLERIYCHPDGTLDDIATEILGWYDHPGQGALEAHMHLIDAHLVGLRVMGTLVSWLDDLKEVEYEPLFPHWIAVMPHPRHRRKLDLAYAMAYREDTVLVEDGIPQPADVWTVYVRPELPSDPPGAPTRGYPMGRMVRYSCGSQSVRDDPWPIPPPGDPSILAGADGDNPVAAAGWKMARVWSPIVLHYAEPPMEHWRLPVASHLCAANSELDVGLTDVLHTVALQLYGQPVYTGPGDPPKVFGRSNVVHVQDPAGSFKFETTGAQPLDHLEALRKVVQLLGIFEGVPSDTFLDQPPSIETGPAKLLRRAELIQERSKRTLQAEVSEQKLFRLKRAMHNAWGLSPKIPWDTTLEMHWGELVTPVAWSDRLAEMQIEKSLMITDVEDMIMERHGVSREEAARRLAQMDGEPDPPKEPVEAQPTHPAPDSPTGDLPEPDNRSGSEGIR